MCLHVDTSDSNDLKMKPIYFDFSKQETDQEAVDIREKCEDYVLSINDLQNSILVIKTPTRRVKTSFFVFTRSQTHSINADFFHKNVFRFHFSIAIFHRTRFR